MVPVTTTSTLGFPRMGPKRELKFALEKHWKGVIDANGLLDVAHAIEESAWKLQVDAGIDRVTVGDFALYDNVLSWTEYLGIFPARYAQVPAGMKRMFAMARGIDGAPALSMKKWLTSNYHYMVPEFDGTSKVQPDFTSYLADVQRGIQYLGANRASPVVLGPVSMVRFIRFHDETPGQKEALLAELIPVYNKLFRDLAKLGVTEIQLHEPVLVFEEKALLPLFQKAYPAILKNTGTSINMVSFFDDVGEDNYKWLISIDEIQVLSLDFTRGDNLAILQTFGFPKTKTLGAGVIDARSVWKADPAVIESLLKTLGTKVDKLRVQPSASLQFVPWDLTCENELQAHAAGPVLCFAIQKLDEIALVARTVQGKYTLGKHAAAWDTYRAALGKDLQVTNRVAKLSEADFCRSEPFETRRLKQMKGVPILPTTTIGSFPQTKGIRSLRTQLKKGLLSKEQYDNAIDQQIAFAIGIQEALGLDILVHGEAERTDMVEFFGQQMDGMLFSVNGWVQSFGSRCVRPPIIWCDISRPHPMTVREFVVAQALTDKPVKGMLTGPVTILNWSFPRADISRKNQAMQIALAIRDEITDLEAAGCVVVQVDEPALREGMPLRAIKKDEYLEWAVDSFRLSTAGAKNETQIHTHMCYCEFEDCMDAIDRLDTDFNSIENARSDNATLVAFQRIGYNKGLGPGTYDIHSPVVPPVEFITHKLKSFLECMPVERLVVNPDCGLKTRTWPETIAALKNMVTATDAIREELGLPTSTLKSDGSSYGSVAVKHCCS